MIRKVEVEAGVLHVRGHDSRKVNKIQKDNGLNCFENSANRHISLRIIDMMKQCDVQYPIYLVAL